MWGCSHLRFLLINQSETKTQETSLTPTLIHLKETSFKYLTLWKPRVFSSRLINKVMQKRMGHVRNSYERTIKNNFLLVKFICSKDVFFFYPVMINSCLFILSYSCSFSQSLCPSIKTNKPEPVFVTDCRLNRTEAAASYITHCCENKERNREWKTNIWSWWKNKRIKSKFTEQLWKFDFIWAFILKSHSWTLWVFLKSYSDSNHDKFRTQQSLLDHSVFMCSSKAGWQTWPWTSAGGAESQNWTHSRRCAFLISPTGAD